MISKANTKHRAVRLLFEILILVAVAVINLLPIYWGVVTSLKSPQDISSYPPKLAGFDVVWTHYRQIMNSGFLQSLLNSVFYSGSSIIAGVILGYLAGYGFQRTRFPFRKILFYIVLAGIPLSVGSSALLIPNYLYLMKIGLTNRWFTLIILYTAYNLPMAIWILRGGVAGVPIEIEEAAAIDGCSRFYIVSSLVPKMMTPSIASSALFIFIGAWNEFIAAAVMIDKPALRSVQLSIYYYQGFYGREWGPLTAAAVVAIIPILLVFSILGRLMVSGMTAGAVKE
ncbi:carbohydrate ABC transporter permease [Breznakiella homolactica]|uniref:sn-glycerol-3-phosphate transport system permease protein UgpE n=1 Tax=Breznakiella homolactica TaxID=2798577 RepID=A0A7T8B8K3_9SPIR|nr:carbohydrate ABC transporter permease [Breznakiella homolactica]QQO08704.1 carbohydrate ABC transporter permease [Breznakiella homolactica]